MARPLSSNRPCPSLVRRARRCAQWRAHIRRMRGAASCGLDVVRCCFNCAGCILVPHLDGGNVSTASSPCTPRRARSLLAMRQLFFPARSQLSRRLQCLVMVLPCDSCLACLPDAAHALLQVCRLGDRFVRRWSSGSWRWSGRMVLRLQLRHPALQRPSLLPSRQYDVMRPAPAMDSHTCAVRLGGTHASCSASAVLCASLEPCLRARHRGAGRTCCR